VTELAQLAYPDVEELLADDRRTVLLLPLGATEPHGPHAPLETDALISLGICRRAAERLADDPEVRALVLPSLPYGVTRYGRSFPGAVTIGEETLRALVVEIARSLAEQGFEWIVLVNSHFEPEQVRTLREAVTELGPSARLLDLTRRRNAERLTEEFRSGSCHAGRYETSLVLADSPELVRAERRMGLESRMIDMPAAIAAGQTDFVAMGMDQAYCGAPAEATAEEGERTFETLADMLVELVREVAGC
jgi:creatinine amidohydrolase